MSLFPAALRHPEYDSFNGLWQSFPHDLNTGIMGLLLTCKQAYNEGIDIFYSANGLRIKSEPLLLHLPQLIPSNRLANMTSIETVIDAHRIDDENSKLPPSYNVDHVKPILDNIATHCHRLHSLYISFSLNSRMFQRGKWRSLDGEVPGMQFRSLERYPLPPLRLPDDSTESSGYWIAEGDTGPMQPWISCS